MHIHAKNQLPNANGLQIKSMSMFFFKVPLQGPKITYKAEDNNMAMPGINDLSDTSLNKL